MLEIGKVTDQRYGWNIFKNRQNIQEMNWSGRLWRRKENKGKRRTEEKEVINDAEENTRAVLLLF